MELLTRQQAEQLWFEPDPFAQFDDLLEALGLYKDILTEYGLNQSVYHQWRFGDPYKKSGEPDRHDYDIKVVDGVEVAPCEKRKPKYTSCVPKSTLSLNHYARRKHLLWLRLRSYLLPNKVK